MTELKVLGTDSKEAGKQKLPAQFSEDIRTDLIKRAVEAIQGNKRQQYGADPLAGKKQAARLSRRRRDYKGAYGKGLSRAPRKTMSRRGTQMHWIGAFAPGTVGGRRAFPARAEHIYAKKINDTERRKAIRSALAASVDKTSVSKRGHKAPASYPFIVSTDFEKLNKAADVEKAFLALGLEQELARASVKKIRAGAGKGRGRPYQKAKGPLLVVSQQCEAVNAAGNIPGVDVVVVNKLNAELLAPGTHAGRLTLYTQAAIQKMDKEQLFK